MVMYSGYCGCGGRLRIVELLIKLKRNCRSGGLKLWVPAMKSI
jgi:hypothetical protein